MNQLSPRLARALEQAKSLPVEAQDAAAAIIEQLAAGVGYPLSEDEAADLTLALAEARQGDFASDVEVDSVLARHGL